MSGLSSQELAETPIDEARPERLSTCIVDYSHAVLLV